MFDLDLAQVMQISLPMRELRKVVRHALRKENVSGIRAIHDALGHVHAGPGDIRTVVHVRHRVDRAAVNAHAHANLRRRL